MWQWENKEGLHHPSATKGRECGREGNISTAPFNKGEKKNRDEKKM